MGRRKLSVFSKEMEWNLKKILGNTTDSKSIIFNTCKKSAKKVICGVALEKGLLIWSQFLKYEQF